MFFRRYSYRLAIAVNLCCCFAVQAQESVWTLQDSIRQGLDYAPEQRLAQAAIDIREAELYQAGRWPNPELALRIDDAMAKEEGDSGLNFSELAISQPLPLSGRLKQQQAMAKAALNASEQNRHYQSLQIEQSVAQHYHQLQLSTEQLQLAQQRLRFADELQVVGRKRERAGELSRLERLRLELIRETAQQALDQAQGQQRLNTQAFRTYLGLKQTPVLKPLQAFDALPVWENLQARLPQHVALSQANSSIDAARAQVRLAQAERLPDPKLNLSYGRDVLNGRRQNVLGVGLSIEVPLWDRKRGRIGAARAEMLQNQAQRDSLRRDLQSQLQHSYQQLQNRSNQAQQYRQKVFLPAQQVFDLTRKAYASGEADILALIDANNTYFDAHSRYLELLAEAWQAAANLRLASGQSLIEGESK